jgi:hypothetical protein
VVECEILEVNSIFVAALRWWMVDSNISLERNECKRLQYQGNIDSLILSFMEAFTLPLKPLGNIVSTANGTLKAAVWKSPLEFTIQSLLEY